MYRVLISLSSNVYAKYNIDRAKRMIKYYFHDVVFSQSIIEVSDDERYLFPFRNAVGVFHIDAPLVEVNNKLRKVEIALGKQPRDIESGKSVIEINIIQYDNATLHAEELEKEHIQKLIKDLE